MASATPTPAPDTMSNRLAIGALSLFIPGTGHVIRGRWRSGVAWWLACTVLYLAMGKVGAWALLASLVARLACVVSAVLARSGPALSANRRLLVIGAMVAGMLGGFVLARTTVVEGYRVPAASMLPTLEIGDYFMIDKLDGPSVGEVIVFRHPANGADFVKRVVAVGGDRLRYVDGVLERNGVLLTQVEDGPCRLVDRDMRDDGWQTIAGRCAWESQGGHRYRVVMGAPPAGAGVAFDDPARPRFHDGSEQYTVPPGHVWVLGDNRPNSNDSRFWGPVPVGDVKGTARFIWMSRGPDGVRWGRLGRTIE